MIQQQVQFDRALPLAILGPIEHRSRQFDDAAAQVHQLILEAKLARTVRRRFGLAFA